MKTTKRRCERIKWEGEITATNHFSLQLKTSVTVSVILSTTYLPSPKLETCTKWSIDSDQFLNCWGSQDKSWRGGAKRYTCYKSHPGSFTQCLHSARIMAAFSIYPPCNMTLPRKDAIYLWSFAGGTRVPHWAAQEAEQRATCPAAKTIASYLRARRNIQIPLFQTKIQVI